MGSIMTQTERLWLDVFRQLHGAFFNAMDDAAVMLLLASFNDTDIELVDSDMAYCGGGPL